MPFSHAEMTRQIFPVYARESTVRLPDLTERGFGSEIVLFSICRDSWEGAFGGQGRVASTPAVPWSL